MDGDTWSGGAGLSFSGRPITPEMVLGIGSNTKTCTAITLLRLQEKGLLNLDDPIVRWVPRHPNIDTTITVRQLLHHTSGIGEFAGGQAYRDSILADPTRVWKPLELLPLVPVREFNPGTSWSYCNTNYLLAGIIAEQVSGLTMHDLYRREIFNDLSMDSTRLYPYEPFNGELAHRWMGGRDAFNVSMNAEWSGAWTAGAILSTSSEMTQLYTALFSGTILNEQSMSQLLSFTGPTDYGLGISKKTIGGEIVIGHTGEIRGYSSVILWVPSLRASITVLTNSIPSNPIAVAAALIGVLRLPSTHVDDDAPDTSSFPATVYDLQGRCVTMVHSPNDLNALANGTYLIMRDGVTIRLLYK